MKTTLFISLLAVLYFATGHAQENNCVNCMKADNGYINLFIGPGIALGDFGSKDIGNNSSGFAEKGYNVELNGGYHLTKSLDLSAKCIYSLFNYDVSGMLSSYSVKYPGTTWKSLGREWELIGGLAGFSYLQPLGKNFIANVKVLGGVMQSTAPELTLKSSDGASFTESKRSASSFAYLFSVGGTYPIGNLIDLAGNIEYISTAPTFNNVTQSFNPSVDSPVTTTSNIKQNIGMLAFDIGVRLKF
jgi:hypothetical protein